MINPDVRHIAEPMLDEDEELFWATKSKGVLINRLAFIGLMILLGVAYLFLKHGDEIALFNNVPFIAKLVFAIIIIYSVIGVFAPAFSYHIMTDRRVMETTNLPLIAIKQELYMSLNMRVGRAKWFGRNSLYIKQSAVQRLELGKFNIPVAAGISAIVLHGVVDPDQFEHIFNNPPS